MPTEMPKDSLPFCEPAQRLEDQADRRASFQALHLRRDVGQHAVLRRNLPRLDHVVGHLEQPRHRTVRIVHRVDADDRVAGAVGQAFVDLGADAFGRVGWVVGLVAAREAYRADQWCCCSAPITRSLLAPYIRSRLDISLVTALIISAVRPFADAADHLARRRIGQDPLAQLTDRPILDLAVDAFVDRRRG